MAEYITKEALQAFPIRANHYDGEHGNKHFINGIETVMEYAENLPAADVAPVVHGRWERESEDCWYCTRCGIIWETLDGESPETHDMKFCPCCGAKMDGAT